MNMVARLQRDRIMMDRQDANNCSYMGKLFSRGGQDEQLPTRSLDYASCTKNKLVQVQVA